jgi:hypothetical protein
MQVAEIVYEGGGELIEVRDVRVLLVFTKAEWIRAIKRGKSIIRARQAAAREEKRIADLLNKRMGFPFFRSGG